MLVKGISLVVLTPLIVVAVLDGSELYYIIKLGNALEYKFSYIQNYFCLHGIIHETLCTRILRQNFERT